jgi:hypothetical protein
MQRIYYLWWKSQRKKEVALVVIDPHGSMVEDLRKVKLYKRDRRRVVYIDPVLLRGYCFTINPLEFRSNDKAEKELYANHLVEAFEEILSDTKLTNHMKALLKPCLYVLIGLKNCSLLDLQDMLIGKRGDLIEQAKYCEIKAYRDFFVRHFDHYLYDKTKQSIYTKLQGLLNSQLFMQMTT